MLANKVFSKASDVLYRMGRWCEGRSLMIGRTRLLSNPVRNSDAKNTGYPVFSGDALVDVITLPMKDDEVHNAMIKGMNAKRKKHKFIKQMEKDGITSKQWDGISFNKENKNTTECEE